MKVRQDLHQMVDLFKKRNHHPIIIYVKKILIMNKNVVIHNFVHLFIIHIVIIIVFSFIFFFLFIVDIFILTFEILKEPYLILYLKAHALDACGPA